MMAPDRMCAPGSEPFSSTTTEISLPCAAASCFRRMAVGQAGGAAADHDHVVFHGFAGAELGEDFVVRHVGLVDNDLKVRGTAMGRAILCGARSAPCRRIGDSNRTFPWLTASIFPAAWPSSPARRAASARSSPRRWRAPAPRWCWPAAASRSSRNCARSIEGEGGDAHVVELDVTDIDSIKAAVAHAETEVGPIDILVNNSGVSTTQRLAGRDGRRLRLHLRHQRQGRLLRRAGGRQAHAGARQGRGARHLHRRAHHQHRLDGGAARCCRRSACTA